MKPFLIKLMEASPDPLYNMEVDYAYYERRMLEAMCVPREMLEGAAVSSPPEKKNAEALMERARALLDKYPDGVPEDAFKAFASTLKVEPMPKAPVSTYYSEGPVDVCRYLFCDHNCLYEECARCASDDCECSTCLACEPWIDF